MGRLVRAWGPKIEAEASNCTFEIIVAVITVALCWLILEVHRRKVSEILCQGWQILRYTKNRLVDEDQERQALQRCISQSMKLNASFPLRPSDAIHSTNPLWSFDSFEKRPSSELSDGLDIGNSSVNPLRPRSPLTPCRRPSKEYSAENTSSNSLNPFSSSRPKLKRSGIRTPTRTRTATPIYEEDENQTTTRTFSNPSSMRPSSTGSHGSYASKCIDPYYKVHRCNSSASLTQSEGEYSN